MQKNTINRQESGLFSSLSNELVYNQKDLAEFLTSTFSIEAFEAQIQQKTNHFTHEKRKTLVSTLEKQYADFKIFPEVAANIRLLEDNQTFTITTGHQLNLLTGPIYFVYKILHVIRLSEALKERYPKHHFVPVFWMASEDHDFAEINHTRLFGKPISWGEMQGGPVGMYDLKNWEAMKDQIFAFFQNNQDSEAYKILHAYNGDNLSTATKSLVNELFGKYGLVIVEPNDAGLKKEFAGIMQQEVMQSFAETAVLKTNLKLEAKGYKTQVFPRPVNLFYIQKGIRERLIPEGDQISIEGLGTFSKEEIISKIQQTPEHFSPNVVLRPVYQECILPNLAYIGGGGEIAYWLQLKDVFDACNIPYPLIQVRNSIQLIDANTHKKMTKLGLDYKAVFADLNDLKKDYVIHNSGEALDFSALDALSASLNALMQQQIVETDPGLQPFAAAEGTKLQKQIEAVKAKLIKQQKSKFDNAMKQLEDIKEKLFPQNGVQERVDNFFSFCAGGEVYSFLENLKSAIDPFEKDLIILHLD